MKFIKQIEIRKFRSINYLKNYKANDLNIFVGKNDQGKSNILRALNLFFNNETDINKKFRFEQDYCFNANTGTGTRKEIRIDLIITPPKGRFKISSDIKWTKKWKKDGSTVDERIVIQTGKSLEPNTNIYKWMNKLRYRYVPAIKSETYFHNLMEELHDVLNLKFNDEIKIRGTEFINGLQDITQNITNDLFQSLGLKNTLQVPSDFKQLFSKLDFGVNDEDGNIYHLAHRGDGIKVRHIPIILFHMAKEEQNLSIPGYVKPDTIWGFEEPENNLEMKYCFDLANEFLKYAKDLQIFITTHSPAFYAVKEDERVKVGFIYKDEKKCSVIKDLIQDDEIHDEMGLLPLITPYIKKINDYKDENLYLKSQLDTLGHNIKYIILTEDQNTRFLEGFLELHDFPKKETEIISYHTSSQLTTSAFSIAKYIISKNNDVKILIHRDQDYLTQAEVDDLKVKIINKGYHPFITPNVDIESLFINNQHIKYIYPHLADEEIQNLIDSCMNDSLEDSRKRFFDHRLAQLNIKTNGYEQISNLHKEFELIKDRVFYGKKVYGLLINKLNSVVEGRPNLIQPSPFLIREEIIAFFNNEQSIGKVTSIPYTHPNNTQQERSL
ncbi:AAA family ATPase [Acinetobacter indicus]|uniref:ATP-dependent nuclease n=1 Tax=Acinetobacter indicus TaxID=756892 RepID=UPI002577383A|nr:AAA family ATPase [Acinetobacter indicus]MDM1281005.1 AAA family ATPase [Acinetobacter indicus]